MFKQLLVLNGGYLCHNFQETQLVFFYPSVQTCINQGLEGTEEWNFKDQKTVTNKNIFSVDLLIKCFQI